MATKIFYYEQKEMCVTYLEVVLFPLLPEYGLLWAVGMEACFFLFASYKFFSETSDLFFLIS